MGGGWMPITEGTRFRALKGDLDLRVHVTESVPESVLHLYLDAYACLEGDPAAINSYTGEYMYQYSWAEYTVGTLNQQR